MDMEKNRRGVNDQPWFIVTTNTNCENRAMLGLAAAGFEVWMPTYQTLDWVGGRKTKRRREWVTRRAAPGYVFGRHPDLFTWPSIRGIDGIVSIRCVGNELQTVPSREIERWRTDLDGLSMSVVEDVYRIGDQLRVVDGPLVGFEAVVERYFNGKGRWVAVSTLNGSLRVQIDRDHLERLSA